MINIPMKSVRPYDKQTVLSINADRIHGPYTSQNIQSVGNRSVSRNTNNTCLNNTVTNNTVSNTATSSQVISKPIPSLKHPVQKGQKISLETSGQLMRIKACLGWNTTNPSCDVDVSAFLLNNSGKVIDDNWFVFYGQEQSPDKSTLFSLGQSEDREIISVDFSLLNPNVSKIVFVLTIHEAFEKHLNFSMIKDAYIRILDQTSNNEIASFMMNEYYSNVTSMMIGEIYQHNGSWKFNAIGNGVARDLAGLCELYGVQVI